MKTLLSTFIIAVSYQVCFSQSDLTQTSSVSLKNELGIDYEGNQSLLSAYYLRYLDKRDKFAVYGQMGFPTTTNAHKNFALKTGALWHYKPSGKSLTLGLAFFYQRIDQNGVYYTSTPPSIVNYTKDGFQMSLAPEIGYTILVNEKIRIYPYFVPVAYTYTDGNDTRTNSATGTTEVTPLEKYQADIAQSFGLKIGLRF